jgi:hypothetical protein
MKIAKAILKINPNAQFNYQDENIDSIEWHNGTTPIPKADIQAQFPIVELDMAMQDLRAKRNNLLADTDYTVLQDSTYTDEQVAEWVIYRQELRDLTNGLTTVEQVDDVIWPTKPGA